MDKGSILFKLFLIFIWYYYFYFFFCFFFFFNFNVNKIWGNSRDFRCDHLMTRQKRVNASRVEPWQGWDEKFSSTSSKITFWSKNDVISGCNCRKVYQLNAKDYAKLNIAFILLYLIVGGSSGRNGVVMWSRGSKIGVLIKKIAILGLRCRKLDQSNAVNDAKPNN